VAQLKNFEAVVESGSRYVNATKLCSNAGKGLQHWRTSKMNKALEEALVTHDENALTYKDVELEGVKGIYVHQLIAPHLARWISAECAIKIGVILNTLLLHEWTEQVNQISINHEVLTKYYESIINDWRCVVDEKNECLEVKEGELAELSAAKKKQPNWNDTHAFTLIRTNNDDALPYYALSCLRRSVGTHLKRIRRLYPYAEVAFQQRQVPDGVNVLALLKEKNMVKARHRLFEAPDMNEDQLIQVITNYCGTDNPPNKIASLNSSHPLAF